jgi:hypothetical protein
MDPGPSVDDGPVPPVPGIDFLKQSYDMAITEPIKVATIKQVLSIDKNNAIDSAADPAQKLAIKGRFTRFIDGIGPGRDFYNLFFGMTESQVATYRGLLQKAIKRSLQEIDEDASAPADALNASVSSVPGIGGRRPGSIKKAALKNLKDRGITGVMLETAFHQLKTRAGVKVVSKMFGFKSWGYLRSDHVLEIKNKEGTMFRYKIARGKTHPVIMAKIPGGPYEEIMTVRVPDYGTDDYDSWSIAKHQARHVTRKLKLKPRYRTRKN